MTTHTIQIEVPGTLLERARVPALDEARELIAFLLENYRQELELLAEFAFADAEVTEEMIPWAS